jgi:cell division protein FtsX
MIIPALASALRRTARITIERPRAGLWAQLALACALFAVAVAGVAAFSVEHWIAARPPTTAAMVVYLAEGTTETRARELTDELRRLQGTLSIELVSPAESARRLVAALGADTHLLDGIDLAQLPGSVEVRLAPGVRDVIALSPTVRALRGAPGVADVVLEDPDDGRIVAALGAVRTIAWTGAALFAGLALIVVLATIRVRMDRGKKELAVAQLLGANPGFWVWPTLLAGALHGALAALLASGALLLALHVYSADITAALAPALGQVELVAPGLALLWLVPLGTVIGAIGGVLAGATREVT